MACQRSTSGRWVGSGGGSEVVGATLRGKLEAGAEGELEAEVEAEAEGEVGGVPLTKAFITIIIHLEHKGKLLSMLLDLVEVPMSHTGKNLMKAFCEVLQTFGIQEKVRNFNTETYWYLSRG